jgi:hypothetical protein
MNFNLVPAQFLYIRKGIIWEGTKVRTLEHKRIHSLPQV